GDSDVKCAVAAIAHYVNEAATHHSSKTWMAGTSGAKKALRAFRPAMTLMRGAFHSSYLHR
ncbi:MAG: hypothetical protein WA706_17425, partial [Pseudolabrys sp.]